jgi:hypothetical protein
MLFRRDASFWEYHKRELAEMGVGFSRVRLARAIARRFCEAVLNPKATAEKLLTKRDEYLCRRQMRRERSQRAVSFPAKSIREG